MLKLQANLIQGVSVTLEDLIALRAPARALLGVGRRATHHQHSGAHHSRAYGRGIDFAEVRPYQPGDDPRYMDWRVTARMGTAYTKLYQEEKQQSAACLVDYRPTMWFGTQRVFKTVLAAEIAALLSWLTVLQGDKVSAWVLTSQHVIDIPCQSQRRGVLRLLNQLVHHLPREAPLQAAAPSLFKQALQRMCHRVRAGSRVYLISDFYDLDAEHVSYVCDLARCHDVTACMVYDPLERDVPLPNRYQLTDGCQHISIDMRDPATARAYHRQLLTQAMEAKRVLQQSGVGVVEITTAQAAWYQLSRAWRCKIH